MLEQRWREAADACAPPCSDADPRAALRAPGYLFEGGLALEGLEDRERARDAFLELASRFPGDARARSALVRASSLDAYLEDWVALATIGDALLARSDLEDVDRIVALGSRGLARIELGDDKSAAADVLDGLDLSDQLHYGERDVLPVAVAQLRFALGELRRVRSERIVIDPPPPDFLARLEERCGGLLEAQAAYAMAVRSVDPHWAAMAGFRVGEMYRTLHQDLMHIPPPATSKTERQREIFYAFMRVRYRILLEKGLRESRPNDRPRRAHERLLSVDPARPGRQRRDADGPRRGEGADRHDTLFESWKLGEAMAAQMRRGEAGTEALRRRRGRGAGGCGHRAPLDSRWSVALAAPPTPCTHAWKGCVCPAPSREESARHEPTRQPLAGKPEK